MSIRWLQAVLWLGATALGVAAAALAVGGASVENGCVVSRPGVLLAWALVFVALTLGLAAVVTAVFVAVRMHYTRVALAVCAGGAAVGIVALIVDWAAAAASLDLCFEF